MIIVYRELVVVEKVMILKRKGKWFKWLFLVEWMNKLVYLCNGILYNDGNKRIIFIYIKTDEFYNV